MECSGLSYMHELNGCTSQCHPVTTSIWIVQHALIPAASVWTIVIFALQLSRSVPTYRPARYGRFILVWLDPCTSPHHYWYLHAGITSLPSHERNTPKWTGLDYTFVPSVLYHFSSPGSARESYRRLAPSHFSPFKTPTRPTSSAASLAPSGLLLARKAAVAQRHPIARRPQLETYRTKCDSLLWWSEILNLAVLRLSCSVVKCPSTRCLKHDRARFFRFLATSNRSR